MIPGIDHWYVCVAELTAGQARWDTARNRCRDRHDLYRALGRITESMHMTTIKTAEGVLEAGPDEPALAAATQREENSRAAAMDDLRSEAERDREWTAYLTRCGEFGQAPLERSVWEGRTRAGGFTPAGPGDRRTTPTPLFSGGPVGAVSREQAGILPTGGLRVTDEMVERGFTVGQRIIADHTLERGDIRLVLEAALTGKGLDT